MRPRKRLSRFERMEGWLARYIPQPGLRLQVLVVPPAVLLIVGVLGMVALTFWFCRAGGVSLDRATYAAGLVGMVLATGLLA